MRFETIGSIGGLAILVLWIALQRPSEHPQYAKPGPCQEETDQINYWKAMQFVREVKSKGQDLDVIVDGKAWATLSMPDQLRIGTAAYCPLALAGTGGVARVVDVQGNEMARTIDGKWSIKPSLQQ